MDVTMVQNVSSLSSLSLESSVLILLQQLLLVQRRRCCCYVVELYQRRAGTLRYHYHAIINDLAWANMNIGDVEER